MFTKNDLKTGMVVECKNGFRYMVITKEKSEAWCYAKLYKEGK